MGPLIFPLLVPILGQVAIWGASIGMSTALLTGVVTAVSYGLQIGIGLGLTFLGNKIFGPRQPKPEDRQVLVREATHPRFRSYGQVKVGGLLAYLTVQQGALYRVIVMGEGEISSVESHWIDDKEITIDGSGDVTSPSTYVNRINIQYRLGTDTQTHYTELAAVVADWTSAHDGLGMAHALVTLNAIKPEKFAKVYPRGEPNYRQIQKAAKVYDPREVAHDPDDPTTWEWSENAALCILDYLTHEDGLGLARTFFADADWEDAADDCDDAITLKAGGTIERYRMATTYDFSERPADVLGRMLQSCDGQLVPTAAGGLKLIVGKWITPTVTIDDDAIIDYEIARGRSIMDTANVIKARYTSRDHDYQATDADEWRDSTDVSARGELVTQLDFLCAPNHSQARRLMKAASYRLNPEWAGTLTCNLRGLAVVGERFITVTLSELGISTTFEVTSDPEIILSDENVVTGVRFSVTAVPSAAYDWVAADEEGTAPATPGDVTQDTTIEDMDNLAAAVEQRTVSGNNKVAVAVISWDAPVNGSLTPQIEIKLTSGGSTSWQGLNIAIDQDQTETGVLIDGEDYDVRGRFVTAAGTEGDWSSTVNFTAVANLTAPSDVTSVTLTAGTDSVTLTFNTPNDANFIKARIYRNTVNNSATATHVQDVYLAQNVAAGVTIASAPVGVWYYWVAASNGSNIEATRVAPTPTNVTVLGAELVANGGFSSGASWTTGTDWSIGAGVATKVAGAGATDLSQAISLTAGYVYRVVFTVSGYSAGTVTPTFTGGSTVTGTARSADGTYTEDLTAVTGNTTLVLTGNAAGAFNIDNVSVKRFG